MRKETSKTLSLKYRAKQTSLSLWWIKYVSFATKRLKSFTDCGCWLFFSSLHPSLFPIWPCFPSIFSHLYWSRHHFFFSLVLLFLCIPVPLFAFYFSFFIPTLHQSSSACPFFSLPLPLLFLCAGKQNTPEQILSEFLLFRYTRADTRAWTHTCEGASGADWLGFKLHTCSMAGITLAVKSHLLLLCSSLMCSVQRAGSSHHVSR